MMGVRLERVDREESSKIISQDRKEFRTLLSQMNLTM